MVFVGDAGGLVAAINDGIGVLCAHTDINLIDLIDPQDINFLVSLKVEHRAWVGTGVFN